MSKYQPLWQFVSKNERSEITFEEAQKVLGFAIDHSFLSFKKELLAYGYEVSAISLKEQKITFKKLQTPTKETLFMQEMHLAKQPFEQIKNGEKTVEIRLNDEKRKCLKVGDVLRFTQVGGNETVTARIVALHSFETFLQLFSSDLFEKTGSGNMTAEQAAESMYAYYSRQQEERFGVLAIELQLT